MDTIYVEEEIANHPRTAQILARFPRAVRIPCRRYGEVFNRRAQNFRLQKRRPALILAQKFERFLIETPPGHGIGGDRNFYFSHMLNCIYDCRYCFLQGMYSSAHYVLFVNFEDFEQAIISCAEESPESDTYFFSGYDGDSLAFEPVTGFARHFLGLFDRLDRAWLELRTKSVRVQELLERAPVSRVVVAFSLAPGPISTLLEHKVPSLERRLDAMSRLAARGWKIGLRFDPLFYCEGFSNLYRRLFESVFACVDPEQVHSITLGPLRFPKNAFEAMVKLHPREKLFASLAEDGLGRISYPQEVQDEMHGICSEMLLRWVPGETIFSCAGDLAIS